MALDGDGLLKSHVSGDLVRGMGGGNSERRPQLRSIPPRGLVKVATTATRRSSPSTAGRSCEFPVVPSPFANLIPCWAPCYPSANSLLSLAARRSMNRLLAPSAPRPQCARRASAPRLFGARAISRHFLSIENVLPKCRNYAMVVCLDQKRPTTAFAPLRSAPPALSPARRTPRAAP